MEHFVNNKKHLSDKNVSFKKKSVNICKDSRLNYG